MFDSEISWLIKKGSMERERAGNHPAALIAKTYSPGCHSILCVLYFCGCVGTFVFYLGILIKSKQIKGVRSAILHCAKFCFSLSEAVCCVVSENIEEKLCSSLVMS